MRISVEVPPTASPSCSYTNGRSPGCLRGDITWVEDFSPDRK